MKVWLSIIRTVAFVVIFINTEPGIWRKLLVAAMLIVVSILGLYEGMNT